MKTKLYLDKRHPDKKGMATLKIVITKKGSIGMIPLFKLLPSQWKDGEVIKHPNAKYLNSIIKVRLGKVESILMEKAYACDYAGKSATEICNDIKALIDPDLIAKNDETQRAKEMENNSFAIYFKKHLEEYENAGTRQLYLDTYNKLLSYCQSEGIDFLSVNFSDITKQWLGSFEKYCLTTQRHNTVNRHLRDIRAVFNAAIDDELTIYYPFRKYKFKKEKTGDKSIEVEKLRSLFNYNHCTGRQQEAIDMFKLTFCLIGINGVDLAKANDGNIKNGRLMYERTKTGKDYSIKIEPEAFTIINRHHGKDGKLVGILDRKSSRNNNTYNYHSYFNWLSKTLKNLGDGTIVPKISSGSARTSWATIAQEDLDIPREVIAAALGHHTVDVTTTYLRTEWEKKIDEANRMVLDWVFYKKKRRPKK